MKDIRESKMKEMEKEKGMRDTFEKPKKLLIKKLEPLELVEEEPEQQAEQEQPEQPQAQQEQRQQEQEQHKQQPEQEQQQEQPQGQEGQAQAGIIPGKLESFRELLQERIGLGLSFDVVAREMTFGERRTMLFFMNGLVKDEVLTEVLMRLTYLEEEQLGPDALHAFLVHYVPAVQVEEEQDAERAILQVLAGASGLYLEGDEGRAGAVLLIDAKSFPSRGPEEPSLERVVRGSRDGFVETMMVNVSLVRRRLRDPGLRYEILRIGERTESDVCLAYVKDLADPQLVKAIRGKLEAVKIDGLPMGDKQLEETIVKRGWNPYPLVRYSERPDVVAAHLLDGCVAVFVDTTPSVMILPTTFFDHVQHAEENRQTPFIGTFLRWVRYSGIFASLFLLPIWMLFVIQPDLKPTVLAFLGPESVGRIPLVWQFIIIEIGVDLLRMASVHTPTPLATAMSLIAAILIGDIAVQTGLFINEVILYMAVAAIGMFATPSYELGLANRIVRLLLIVAVASLGIPGFVLVSTIVFVLLVRERSFNRPYMWPLIPFDRKALWNIVVRVPALKNRIRPNLLRPQQREKFPKP